MKASSSSTRITTVIGDIPDGLLIEILVHLPLKSAKQCMLVSNHWYSLLSTPYFAHRFFQINYSFALLLAYEYNYIQRLFVVLENHSTIFRSRILSFSYLPCDSEAQPVACCRDLVLCRSNLNSELAYYICNPLTRRWIQLPPCPLPCYKRTRLGFLVQGSGTSSSFKYAVVRIPWVDGHHHPHYKICVFTSYSAVWREVILTCMPQTSIRPPWLSWTGVPYKGMLFWSSQNGLIGISPFNEGELIRLIEFPPGASSCAPKLRVAICRGILRCVGLKINSLEGVLTICVWNLEDFEKVKWCLEREITFSGLKSVDSTWVLPRTCDPSNGDIVYIQMGLSTFASCNLEMQTLDVICHESDIWSESDDEDRDRFNDAFIYELPWEPSVPYLPQGNRSHDI